MRNFRIEIPVCACSYDELSEADRQLIDAAKEATSQSYAPYSHFAVGAAALLEDGTVVTGSNQENAAYPSGTCAERTTLFYANSHYPDQGVKALAIAARNTQGFLDSPIPPCGACRQVLLETERRYSLPIRILLYGVRETYCLQGVKSLLPLSVETMCTSSLQKRRKKVLASNFQPALWAITTYNSLLTPDWHEYPHFVSTWDVCGYSIL